MSDPHIVPANLIGAEAVRTLHGAGYRIVPAKPTPAMIRAAANKMRKMREANDGEFLRVTAQEKARVRWDAMLQAWSVDYHGMVERGAATVPNPWHVRKWRKLKRFGRKLVYEVRVLGVLATGRWPA